MRIIYTRKAQQDLADTYAYIANDLSSPGAAQQLTEKIMQAVRSLEALPERNPLYQEEPWHSQGLRFLPVKNYLVFYTVSEADETISIARIMYGGRKISDQLEETMED